MNRSAASILLEKQHAWPLRIVRIILHDDCRVEPTDDLTHLDTIGSKFIVAVSGYPYIATCHEHAHHVEGLTQRLRAFVVADLSIDLVPVSTQPGDRRQSARHAPDHIGSEDLVVPCLFLSVPNDPKKAEVQKRSRNEGGEEIPAERPPKSNRTTITRNDLQASDLAAPGLASLAHYVGEVPQEPSPGHRLCRTEWPFVAEKAALTSEEPTIDDDVGDQSHEYRNDTITDVPEQPIAEASVLPIKPVHHRSCPQNVLRLTCGGHPPSLGITTNAARPPAGAAAC
jgi:hypothetical protein